MTRCALNRRAWAGLAAAGCAAAWLTLSAQQAAAQSSEAPPLPIEQRLGERWRWRAIAGPDGQSSFLGVWPWKDGGLIALDAHGLLAYDGYDWKREAGWTDIGWTALAAAVPTADGLIAVSNGRIVSIDARGEQRLLLQAGNPARVTPPCRQPDGSVLLGLEQRILRIDATGVHDLFGAPESSNYLSGLACDNRGQLWVCTDAGLFRRVGEGWVAVPGGGTAPSVSPRNTYGLSGGERLAFLPSVTHARQRGFAWDGATLTEFYDEERPGTVSCALATPEGEFLVAVNDPVLRVQRAGQWHDVELPQEHAEFIKALCLTDEGRLAVVCGTGTLSVCDLAAGCWRRFDPVPVGLSPVVNALAPARAGGLWIGTPAGVARWDGRAFTDVHARVPGQELPPWEVTTLCEDSRGRLWVGSGSSLHGAACLDNGTWTLHSDADVFGPNCVHRIVRDGDDLWFTLIADPGDEWETGALVRLRGDTFTAYRTLADGTPLPRCYDVLRDSDGTLLAGAFHGLLRFDGQHWTPLDSPLAGERRSGKSLYRTRDDALLIGSGLVEFGVLARRDGEWREVQSSDGRRAAAASFCETADGRVWFASRLGLFLMDGDQCHDVATPLSERNIWPLLPDHETGGMWLGLLGGGLARFCPGDRKPPITLDLAVRIEQNGNVVASWRGVDAWNETPPDRVRSRVRLDGAEVTADAGGNSTFSNIVEMAWLALPPGRHSLEVTSIDTLDNVEAQPAILEFTVPEAPLPLLLAPPMLLAMTAVIGIGAWLVALQVNRARERQRAQQAQQELNDRLSALTLKLLSTEEDQRRKLSRDLHDNLGQICTALCLDIQRGARQDDPEKRAAVLEHAEGIAREMLDTVRKMSFGLRPLMLDDHGLQQAVATALTEFTTVSGIDVQADLDFAGSDLPEEVTGHVYRILQESLTNVQRHARAETVDVRLHTSDAGIELTVSDDGTGFDPDRLPLAARFGLLGMQERAELMDGSFRILSSPHGGTSIHVSIPARRSRAEGDRDEHSGSSRHG